MNISVSAKLADLGYNIDGFDAGTTEAFKVAVGGLAKSAQDEWVRLAQSRLHTSRDTYINGLRQAESFQAKHTPLTSTYEIQLVGRMPNNFEFGMASFDMKSVRPGWLGGGKARTAKDGHKYVVIPLRHSTSSDTRLAYTGKAARAGLKEELKRTVKKYGLDRMVKAATGEPIAGPVARIPSRAAVHPYLRGLTRIQSVTTTRSGARRGSGQLMTWRVMSENSPADSWIHPGIEAANLLREVELWTDRELENVVKMILESS